MSNTSMRTKFGQTVIVAVFLCVVLAVASARGETEAEVSPEQRARSQFGSGVKFLQEKKFLSAAESFERAVQAMPNFFEAHLNGGIALVQLGRETRDVPLQLQRFQLAAEKFSRAAELNPKEKLTYLLWSETLVWVGDLPLDASARLGCYMGAAEKCRLAAELAPDDWEIYNKWGVILTTKLVDFAPDSATRVKLCEEAAGYFAKAAERARFSSEKGVVYANWGGTLTEMARHSPTLSVKRARLQAATEKFEQSVKVIASVPATYALWGVTLLELGKVNHSRTDYRAAIEKFRTSLEIRPDDPAVLYSLACAYALSENSVLAVRTLKQCFAVDRTGTYISQAHGAEDLKSLRGNREFEDLFGDGGRQPAAPVRSLK